MAVVPADAPQLSARLAGWRYPLAIGMLSRVLTFVVVGAIGLARRGPEESVSTALLARFGAWDGIWYQRLADYGYDPTVAHGNGVAFSPLYPMLMRYVHAYLSISYVAAGVLISTICFFAALILLYRLVERRSGTRIARRVVWLTAFFPTAYLFSSVYTESVYLLLTVATFALLERSRIVGASLVGVLAVLTRPTGIMLVPSMAIRIWKDHNRRVSWRLTLVLAPLLLLPIVYVAFGAYLYYRTGDPFATQSAQASGWGRGINVLLVLGLPIAVLSGLVIGTHNPSRVMYIADTLFAMTWAVLLIEGTLRRRLPSEYLLYGALAVILPVLAGTYLALPRYGMGIFVVMWLAAMHVAERPVLERVLWFAMPLALVITAIVSLGFDSYTP
ncbi:MAG: hypothetical protein JHD05_01955 [Thermoleophilia bacterium]|jgi:hypothetical protein|nr:hypothetical protein [Thermoleophilia bacterium]